MTSELRQETSHKRHDLSFTLIANLGQVLHCCHYHSLSPRPRWRRAHWPEAKSTKFTLSRWTGQLGWLYVLFLHSLGYQKSYWIQWLLTIVKSHLFSPIKYQNRWRMCSWTVKRSYKLLFRFYVLVEKNYLHVIERFCSYLNLMKITFRRLTKSF